MLLKQLTRTIKEWLRDGRFNPYREPNRQQEQPKQQQQTQTQSNSILALSDSTNHDEMRSSTHLDAWIELL